MSTNDNIHKLEFIDLTTNVISEIYSSTVLFADGGGASMYFPSASSLDKTCDGIALASKMGLDLVDMEFVQFHPTGLLSENPQFNGSLFEESLRFSGAKIYNKDNERFLFNYLELGEQATRDKVSRAIYMEIEKGKGFENGGVKLDFTDCYDLIKSDYPALLERLIQAGYDIDSNKFVYIKPTAHFMMGGVKINERCETKINGLYFAGESAGGIHGANRLGGNGLTEALVYSKIAGDNATEYYKKHAYEETIVHLTTNNTFNYSHQTSTLLNDMESFKKAMYSKAGLVRTKESLIEMLNIIEKYEKNVYPISKFNYPYLYHLKLDFLNYLLVSKAIVHTALKRNESRGSHYRADYPNASNENKNYSTTFNNDVFEVKDLIY
ncbi:TPA: FAD-binding protein [Staphylococcus aureus]|nr:FAD-binding protein [Staphylococcus aureus]